MSHILPHVARALGAEVPDIKPHRPTSGFQFLRCPALARLVSQQVVIGKPGIGIRHDDVGSQNISRRQLDATGAAVLDENLVNLGLHPERAALFADNLGHVFGNRSNAAHGVMHSEFLFEMRHENVHRRHIERIAADEQRMKRQCHAQPLIFYASGRMGIDRPVCPQHRKARQDANQITQLVHRPATQILESEPVPFFAVAQELVVSGDVPRRQSTHLFAHGLCVLARGEFRSVRPTDFVERIKRAQIDLFMEIPATDSP